MELPRVSRPLAISQGGISARDGRIKNPSLRTRDGVSHEGAVALTADATGAMPYPPGLRIKTQPRRLQNDDPDPDTPRAITLHTFDRFADPARLPAPDAVVQRRRGGTGTADHTYYQYGNLFVPVELKAAYEAARTTMAHHAGRGVKYLATLEDPKRVETTLYAIDRDASRTQRTYDGLAELPRETATLPYTVPKPRATGLAAVFCGLSSRPSDASATRRLAIAWDPHEASVASNGTVHPALLGAVHEFGHAARYRCAPGGPFGWTGGRKAAGPRYVFTEEKHNISKLEADVAGVLGFERRDEHVNTSTFRAQTPFSTEPRYEADRTALAEAVPKLHAATQEIDRTDFDIHARITPEDERSPGYRALGARDTIARRLRRLLNENRANRSTRTADASGPE